MAFVSDVQAAGDVERGELLVETCLGCHGIEYYVNTYPTYNVPKIAGQTEVYLVSALKAYREGTRAHETMRANAGLFSDQDIEDIAAWFAAQGNQRFEAPEGVQLSEGHPATTCAACHAADGNSVIPQNPIIAGQYASYLEYSLKAYRSGERQNAVMAGFATNLTDEDIDTLADWFSSHSSRLETAPIN